MRPKFKLTELWSRVFLRQACYWKEILWWAEHQNDSSSTEWFCYPSVALFNLSLCHCSSTHNTGWTIRGHRWARMPWATVSTPFKDWDKKFFLPLRAIFERAMVKFTCACEILCTLATNRLPVLKGYWQLKETRVQWNQIKSGGNQNWQKLIIYNYIKFNINRRSAHNYFIQLFVLVNEMYVVVRVKLMIIFIID